ncbi:hypothetical protein P175DRAFT_0304995 [Aspergillus ochraceoroseus IBT 24754]|uniref:Uncharacterized protein n=1 Tax=Aspergillus ochraceoroseus IBT 24754 TaxID=1392256 RepID=A0A2T5LT99_9EURO|nr:uncharacterized protein P175DRAFT_0304995 [Aspergillus ochraceoroseus IBT 24754]PTU19510.1 hypothetical protein P175DRAFT_0304995 [Aspergillus ochraceoroseus IBT 24754]
MHHAMDKQCESSLGVREKNPVQMQQILGDFFAIIPLALLTFFFFFFSHGVTDTCFVEYSIASGLEGLGPGLNIPKGGETRSKRAIVDSRARHPGGHPCFCLIDVSISRLFPGLGDDASLFWERMSDSVWVRLTAFLFLQLPSF